MERAIKFLGICILLSAVIFSISTIYNNVHNANRYEIRDAEGTLVVIDGFTGNVYRLDNNNKVVPQLDKYILEK